MGRNLIIEFVLDVGKGLCCEWGEGVMGTECYLCIRWLGLYSTYF